MAYSLLIIDDDLEGSNDHEGRKITYEKVFGGDGFNVSYVSNPSELNIAVQTPVDGYLLDIILDKGQWGRERWTSKRVIDDYLSSKGPPIFLVSQGWSEDTSRT
ncbi:MAG: hypothetical protein KJO08_06335, partial [Gammaproteobacteria bacterium]|nr:hypothetical protein [Gammaproteobacteria bacterium]NNJ85006.1 hypothetical protein [Gammaproteobacteria bacterium]